MCMEPRVLDRLCKVGRTRRILLCEESKNHKPSVVWLCLAQYYLLSHSLTALDPEPALVEDRHCCRLGYEVAHSPACQEVEGIDLC